MVNNGALTTAKQTLDVSSLRAGIYFLEVNLGEARGVERFVKK